MYTQLVLLPATVLTYHPWLVQPGPTVAEQHTYLPAVMRGSTSLPPAALKHPVQLLHRRQQQNTPIPRP